MQALTVAIGFGLATGEGGEGDGARAGDAAGEGLEGGGLAMRRARDWKAARWRAGALTGWATMVSLPPGPLALYRPLSGALRGRSLRGLCLTGEHIILKPLYYHFTLLSIIYRPDILRFIIIMVY